MEYVSPKAAEIVHIELAIRPQYSLAIIASLDAKLGSISTRQLLAMCAQAEELTHCRGTSQAYQLLAQVVELFKAARQRSRRPPYIWVFELGNASFQANKTDAINKRREQRGVIAGPLERRAVWSNAENAAEIHQEGRARGFAIILLFAYG